MTTIRISDDNRGNVGRSSTTYTPDPQASTNAWTLVADSVIDTVNDALFSYTIQNSGANTISWKILAGNTDDIADAIEIKASADILTTARDSYSSTSPVWRYYGVYIKSKVNDVHGEATVVGFGKG